MKKENGNMKKKYRQEIERTTESKPIAILYSRKMPDTQSE
jgi:hypothetical protein